MNNINKSVTNLDSKIMQITVEFRFVNKINPTNFMDDFLLNITPNFTHVDTINNSVLNTQNQTIGIQNGFKLKDVSHRNVLLNISEESMSFVMDSHFELKQDYITNLESILEIIKPTLPEINRIGLRTTLYFDQDKIYDNTNIRISINDDVISNEKDSIVNIYYAKKYDKYSIIIQGANKAQILDLSKKFIFASVLDVDLILMNDNSNILSYNNEITEMYKSAKKLILTVLR